MALFLAASLALAPRPALRLGGEWAGWRCDFDPFSGAMRSNFQGATTERWEGAALQRRSVEMTSSKAATPQIVSDSNAPWDTLPVANSGSTSLMPGARSFGTVAVDMLNANAWALDQAESTSAWRCESVFDGLGGERPGERRDDAPEERTRVVCTFNPNNGQISRSEPVLVWQERCWRVRPTVDYPDEEHNGARSLDASVVGMSCFGEEKRLPYEPTLFSSSRLSLPGGVELKGMPGLLEICVTAAPGQSWRKLIIRRSWVGGTCYASVRTIGDLRSDCETIDELDEIPEDCETA